MYVCPSFAWWCIRKMMASMMLRSAKSAISKAQIYRRGFPIETGLARQFVAPATAGQLNQLASAPPAIARSEALAAYSTATAAPSVAAAAVAGKSVTTLRPLSPHLTIFKPQLNSTVSISNRISAALLVTVILSSYLLYLKIGGVCLTFASFYQLFFYASKYLVPVTTEVTALALAFHLFYAIRHLITK